MRRIISFILIVFILVWSYNLFINSFIELEEIEEEPYKGIIKIEAMDVEGFPQWLRPKLRNFERANSGVYIDIVSVDSNEIGDIIPINYASEDFAIFQPLNDYFENEDLDKFRVGVLESLYYNEELLGLPIGLGNYCIYINVDKFNERMISPPLNGNWTYEEFVETLEKFKQSPRENGIIKEYSLLAPMDKDNYNIWGLILVHGGEYINYKRSRYNFYGEKAIKGLEELINLKFKYGALPDFFGIINEEISREMFIKDENVAVYIGDSFSLKTLEDNYRDGEGFNFNIVDFPSGDKNTRATLNNYLFSYGIVESQDPKKVDMCVKLLKYLTRDSNQRTLEEIRLFTVKNTIKDMYKDNITMKKLEEGLDYSIYIPLIDNYLKIEEIIHGELQAALLGEKKSYEAIETAKTRVENLSQ